MKRFFVVFWIGGILSQGWGDGEITQVFFEPFFVPEVYRITQAQVALNGEVFRLLRFIGTSNGRYFLAVNENSLESLLVPESRGLRATNVSNTLYEILLQRMLLQKTPLGRAMESGSVCSSDLTLILTTDLCPTSKAMSREFFLALEEASSFTGHALPVVVFFSGKWIITHTNDLAWLKQRKLNVTAGNHTYSHHIFSNQWTRKEVIAEIINTEKVMLYHGILPSVWFRFPGLRYHPDEIQVLAELGLLPVDTTIWIGQKKLPSWAVVLSHANGTQPVEVNHLKRFLSTNTNAFLQGKIRFADMTSYGRELMALSEKSRLSVSSGSTR